MQRHIKAITAILLAIVMAVGLAACSSDGADNSNRTTTAGNAGGSNTQGGSALANAPDASPAPAANTGPITVVWYPNESSNTHAEIRAEVNRLIEQATGRRAEERLTTDYTIAIEAIASGSADLAMAMGAVGYIEAKNRNPAVDVLFVNSDADWGLDGAKYFAWLCVPIENADEYRSGSTFSIDNIKGKNMSFVSNSSTSGFRVPTASIISHFASENLTEDDLIEGGRNMFFNEVYFGGSHQGSLVNLLNGNADVTAVCDIELHMYIELSSGVENEVGAVYKVRADADAPFDQYAGREFTVIASVPVFNGPNVVNRQTLSEDEIEAIAALFTSEEVASNPLLFFDPNGEDAMGLYRKTSSYGYVRTVDSWYDPYR